jgi:hypothetical protein
MMKTVTVDWNERTFASVTTRWTVIRKITPETSSDSFKFVTASSTSSLLDNQKARERPVS